MQALVGLWPDRLDVCPLCLFDMRKKRNGPNPDNRASSQDDDSESPDRAPGGRTCTDSCVPGSACTQQVPIGVLGIHRRVSDDGWFFQRIARLGGSAPLLLAGWAGRCPIPRHQQKILSIGGSSKCDCCLSELSPPAAFVEWVAWGGELIPRVHSRRRSVERSLAHRSPIEDNARRNPLRGGDVRRGALECVCGHGGTNGRRSS